MKHIPRQLCATLYNLSERSNVLLFATYDSFCKGG